MAERLLSVGIDVGTTTTQLVLSCLQVENRAGGFSVPRLEITRRQILHRGAIRFTPLKSRELVDAEAVRALVEQEYRAAGICPRDVDTGAIIITGETARKENAAAVLEALEAYAGDFVVATAGPDLESLLAAKGSGAVEHSRRTGERVLHMDIGGGTSNLALVEEGQVVATACLDVGGRLIKLDEQGRVCYISPVLEGMTTLQPGMQPSRQELKDLAVRLASVLEMAAGLRERTPLFTRLTTAGTVPLGKAAGAKLSFSGGVAACMGRAVPWDAYGDLGPLLAQAIRESRLCSGSYRLGEETIRATVIGAGCHSTQLSGSTVFCQGVRLPLKGLPVTVVGGAPDGEALKNALRQQERWGVLALEGKRAPSYAQVQALAQVLAEALEGRPCYIALQEDMAKALGNALKLRLPAGTPILCIDGVALPPGSYLDVGCPVGPALPVVIKTLILEKPG